MVKSQHMRRFISQKRFILLLSVVSLILLLLLAPALRNVEFQAGRPLGRAETQTIQYSVSRAVSEFVEVPLWKRAAFWVMLFLLVLLVSSILTPEGRRRLIRMFLTLTASIWIFLYLLENRLITLPDLTSVGGSALDGAAAEEIPPLPVFAPPELPGWMNYLISLGVVLALLTLTWSLQRWWKRFNTPIASPDDLKKLASVARASLIELSQGGNWADAVTNCYVRMSEVVGHKRGLHRRAAMTPAEFARRLESAGLPGDPVRRLTRLFEAVRYGTRKPAQNEINEAVSCLNDILRHCGEEV